MKNIELKMSTVVYRTHCELWNPQSIYECYPDGAIYSDPIAINEHDRVAWFVIENRMPVDWGKIETIADVRYDLHVVYWDESNQLLYINGLAQIAFLMNWQKRFVVMMWSYSKVKRFIGLCPE
jgi:hypothetical protein